MYRQRTATILQFPRTPDRLALWGQVAQHLGVPHQHAAINRRPWYWLNQSSRGLAYTK